ncbi:MAG: hypothetical protein ACE5QF_05965 [Thermoplasmata archaeon]
MGYMKEEDRRYWKSEVRAEKRSLEAAQRDFKGKTLTYAVAALASLIIPLFTFVIPGMNLSDMTIATLISVFVWLLYTTGIAAPKWREATREIGKCRKAIKKTMLERGEVFARSKAMALTIICLSCAILIIEIAIEPTWTIWFLIPLVTLLVAFPISFIFISRHPGTFIDSLAEITQEHPLLSFAFPFAVLSGMIAIALTLIIERWSALSLQVSESFPLLVGLLAILGLVGVHLLMKWDQIMVMVSLNSAKIKDYEELGKLIRQGKVKTLEEVEKRLNNIKDTHPDYTS